MCDVASTLAIGSGIAGTALHSIGAGQAAKAERTATAAERERQAAFRDTSMGYVDTAREGTSRPAMDAAAAAATADRAADYRATAQVREAQGGYLPGQDSAPQIVRDEIDRRRGLAQAFVNQQAGARANLGGWSDALFGAQTRLARSGQGIAQQASFARGSADALGPELRSARNKGAQWRAAGDFVTGGGQLAAGSYDGANGWGRLFGSSPAVTTPASRVGSTGRIAGPV